MQKIIIIKISQSVKDSTNKKRFEMIFLCRIRGHGFLRREERYYGKWTLKWWVRVIYVCLSSFLCAFNRWGKSALNFYMHVRLGLRFHSNKVFHLLIFVSEGSIVSFFETILKSERIVLRLRYHIFETFLCTLATLDVLELARLGGKATTSHNKHSQ